MNCPIDNTPLAITERQGIEIDYCPKCRGVWLDRGELDKLIERNAQYNARPDADDDYQNAALGGQPQGGYPAQGGYPTQQTAPPQGQPNYPPGQQRPASGPDIAGIVGDLINKGLEKKRQQSQYGGQHKKKKGGLLGELFDF